MELFISKEIHDKEYRYAVKFNRTMKTMRYFDKFIYLIGEMFDKEYDAKSGMWLLPDFNYEKLVELDARLFPPKKSLKEKMGTVLNVESKQVENCDDIGKGMKLQPYKYQKEIIKYSLDAENTLIVSPCGSGKTPMGIGLYLEAVAAGKVKGPGMIVVKASLKMQWAAEIRKFSDLRPKIIKTYKECTAKEIAMIKNREKNLEKCDPLKREELNDDIKSLKKMAKRNFEQQFADADLFVLNYETLRDVKVRSVLHKINPQYIFADEIHYVKSDTTSRSKALCEFSMAKIKAGATATPLQRDPRDIFGIFKFIKPDIFPKKGDFERFYIKWAGRGRVAGSKNEKDLNKSISPYMIIKTKEEVSKQLPKLVVMQRYCDLEPQQLAVTQQLMEELDELHEQEKALNAKLSDYEAKNNPELKKIEAAILMRQTFAQELADSEQLLIQSESEAAKDYITGKSDNKLEILIDLLEEIIESGEKVCIFSRYKRMQKIITEYIQKVAKNNSTFKDVKIAYVNGSLSDAQRYNEVYDKFTNDDDYKILIMSDAGAEGINLSKCKYIIEMEPAESYAIQTQRHGRHQRADSIHDTVFVYQLIANESYDEIALKIVAKKERYDGQIVKGMDVN